MPRFAACPLFFFCLCANAFLFSGETPDSISEATLARAALEKGLDGLVALQAEDGGWHSDTYGVLKPGIALTAHILDLMTALPEDLRAKHKEALANGFAFLEKATAPDGSVGTLSEWQDYPVYATAYTLLALSRAQPSGWRARAEKHAAWLLAMQNGEATDCLEKHPAHGGWNPQGRPNGLPPHADLSTTRVVAQALLAAQTYLPQAEARLLKLRTAFNAMSVYRARCQNFVEGSAPDPVNDGGFVFAATRTELNKAEKKEGAEKGATGFASYATATADGVLLLRAQIQFYTRVDTDQAVALNRFLPPLKAAMEWLDQNIVREKIAGFESNHPRAEAMQFYYRAVMAEVSPSLKPALQAPLRTAWLLQSLRLQQDKGLFANPNKSMKEDDPLIATPLALRTLLPYGKE